jgi:hypothetical protein
MRPSPFAMPHTVFFLHISLYTLRNPCKTHYRVPRYTEVRIRDLCTEALAAKTPGDFERTITELRAALEEHIHLAKDSLEAQIGNFPLLGGVARKSSWKK